MTRSQALIAITKVLSATGTAPTPLLYANRVLEVLDEALTFEPQVVEVSAKCHGAAAVKG